MDCQMPFPRRPQPVAFCQADAGRKLGVQVPHSGKREDMAVRPPAMNARSGTSGRTSGICAQQRCRTCRSRRSCNLKTEPPCSGRCRRASPGESLEMRRLRRHAVPGRSQAGERPSRGLPFGRADSTEAGWLATGGGDGRLAAEAANKPSSGHQPRNEPPHRKGRDFPGDLRSARHPCNACGKRHAGHETEKGVEAMAQPRFG